MDVRIGVAEVRVDGVRIHHLFLKDRLSARSLTLDQPQVRIHLPRRAARKLQPDAGRKGESTGLSTRLQQALPAVSVATIRVQNGRLETRRGATTRGSHRVEDLSLTFQGVRIDSAAAAALDRILFADSVALSVAQYEHLSADSLYRFAAGPVRVRSPGRAAIERVTLEPTVPDEVLFRRLRFREDRVRVEVEGVVAYGLDLRQLVERGALVAERIGAGPFRVDVFSNKHIPADPAPDPRSMPPQRLRDAGMLVRVDSVSLQGGAIRYSELAREGIRPGHITFDAIEAVVTNITNDETLPPESAVARIEARTRLWGAVPLHTAFQVPIRSRDFDLNFRGNIGRMDATVMNQMFLPVDGIRIESGAVDSIWFDVDVRDGSASGALVALYSELEVEKVDRDSEGGGLIAWLQSLFVDATLESRNPPEEEAPPRAGTVQHTRQPPDSFFKFLWESVRSGLLSVVGA